MTRAVAGVVVNIPEPAISAGKPSLPEYWARFVGTAVLIQGPTHIHAIRDPNPIWNPGTSGWTYPPPVVKPKPSVPSPRGDGDIRWSVDSLPNPAGFSGGWYWLGDPDPRDSTAGIALGCRQWGPAAGSSGPSWRSFYPFKPSVNSYNGYIAGERSVHHAKGVHCNSHYVEHMWMDLGASAKHQPFTWIVVATVMSNPFGGYRHHLLDSGRNPDAVGFPRLGANFAGRRIGDNLSYRTSLAVVDNTAQMLTATGNAPMRNRAAPGFHPRMYASVFNGSQSLLAAFGPFGKNLCAGRVSSSAQHRFMVLGRENGWISQSHASNILVFEIRYWRHALSGSDLHEQYEQLSSTHQFNAYKTL